MTEDKKQNINEESVQEPQDQAQPETSQSQGETVLNQPFQPIDLSALDISGQGDENAAKSKDTKQDSGESIDKLKAELAAATDRELRAHAELENFRKRTYRQMEDERRYASMSLIRDLLPVLDNMGRALEAAEQKHDLDSLIQGVTMMRDQIVSLLDRHDCKRINALHEPFDPHLHESIAQQPTDEFPPGTIVLETQAGFLLHDRVVRPSQVILATAPPEADEQ